MIISADVIESSETTDTSLVATTSEQAQVLSPKLSNQVLSFCKNLNKLSGSKTKITWKYFLTEILNFDSGIPSNLLLIAKLNDLSADNERELYSVLSNEADFRACKKLAKEKNCSLSVFVEFIKNGVFDQKNAQKYIEDFFKPNSVHFSVTIFGRSHSSNSNDSSKNVKKMPSDVNQKLIEMQENLSLVCKNLNDLRINFESNNDLLEKSMSEPLNSDNEPQSTTSLSTSVFEMSQTSTQNLDSGLDLKSTAINSNDDATVLLEETSKESASDITAKENNENLYSSLSSSFDVEGGARISKIWKIRNNGNSRWTKNLTLRCIAGNISPIPEHCTSIPVRALSPGEEDFIRISFRVPNFKIGSKLFSIWRFTHKNKSFGTPLNLNATIKPSGKSEKKFEPSNVLPLIDLKTENDIIEFPTCFDLDSPFLTTMKTGEVKLSLPARLQGIFAEYNSIKSSQIKTNEPSTSSGKSPGKSKIAKKMELIENRRQVCHAKKRQLKTAKQCSGQLAFVEKIKCKNATNRIGHYDAERKDSEPASGESKRSDRFSANFSNPLQGSLETLSFVGQTLYNIFTVPGTSVNSQEEGDNKKSNTNKGSRSCTAELQKLSEISNTVQELLQISLPGTTSNTATATSAATSSNSSQSNEKAKASENFSVDSVD